MKTIRLLLAVTAVALVTVASAFEKPKLNVIPLSPDRAIVSVSNDNEAYFELKVESENGSLVYYKLSNKPITAYQKVFDFTNLEDGNYTLNVKVNDTKVSRDFVIANSGISVGNSRLSFDPWFSFENGILKFSYLNFDRENLKMKIYDRNNQLVYQTNLGNNFTITTGYNLNKLESGKYRVELSSFDNLYSYDLAK